jgi:hypothetical protein
MAQLMRAVKRFHYPTGVKHRPGDTFMAKGRHAMQLAMAGLAVVVEEKKPKPDDTVEVVLDAPPNHRLSRAYETRHMEAKPVSAMTVSELREHADKKGISLPRGYLAKATLAAIIERA